MLAYSKHSDTLIVYTIKFLSVAIFRSDSIEGHTQTCWPSSCLLNNTKHHRPLTNCCTLGMRGFCLYSLYHSDNILSSFSWRLFIWKILLLLVQCRLKVSFVEHATINYQYIIRINTSRQPTCDHCFCVRRSIPSSNPHMDLFALFERVPHLLDACVEDKTAAVKTLRLVSKAASQVVLRALRSYKLNLAGQASDTNVNGARLLRGTHLTKLSVHLGLSGQSLKIQSVDETNLCAYSHIYILYKNMLQKRLWAFITTPHTISHCILIIELRKSVGGMKIEENGVGLRDYHFWSFQLLLEQATSYASSSSHLLVLFHTWNLKGPICLGK